MNSFFKKLIRRYRLIILSEESLKEVGSFSFHRVYIISLFMCLLVFFLILSLLLVRFSPVGGIIFDYSKKSELSKLYMHIDSIESLVNKQLNYTENLKLIFNTASSTTNEANNEVLFSLKSIDRDMYEKDSVLTSYIQSLSAEKVWEYNKKLLARLNLSNPVKGIVTSSFNSDDGHFGVDVAAEQNAKIKSVLAGVVMFSGFAEDFGNYIIINHPDDFCSVYLHASSILKKQGDIIKSGEVIALVGSTGKLSTAPHLHFELWSGSIPIDPEKYIDFY